EKFDTVDVLVNNAGFGIFSVLNNAKLEEIESQMSTNFLGMVYCVKAFLPKMLEQRSGHIVNVASVAASFGIPGMASYCASKLEIVVPQFVRIAIWLKQTFPYLINPIVGGIFRKSARVST